MGRPKKEKKDIPFDAALVESYIKQLFILENEKRVVSESISDLKDQYKEQVDLKLVANVIKIVKAQLKVTVSDETQQQLQEVVMDKINMIA